MTVKGEEEFKVMKVCDRLEKRVKLFPTLKTFKSDVR